MTYDFVDYTDPNNYTFERNDSLTRGKRKHYKNSIFSHHSDKTLLIHSLPFTDEHTKNGNSARLMYVLSTISSMHLNTMCQNGDFEGDLSLERSMYQFIHEFNFGGKADRRVLVFGEKNYYSGYVNAVEQHGKIINIDVRLLIKNPQLPPELTIAPKTVELVSLPIDHSMGFNLKNEKSSDIMQIQSEVTRRQVFQPEKMPTMILSKKQRKQQNKQQAVVNSLATSKKQVSNLKPRIFNIEDPKEIIYAQGDKKELINILKKYGLLESGRLSSQKIVGIKNIHWSNNSLTDWRLMYLALRSGGLRIYKNPVSSKIYAYVYFNNKTEPKHTLAIYCVDKLVQK